jgi:hypothetical protein
VSADEIDLRMQAAALAKSVPRRMPRELLLAQEASKTVHGILDFVIQPTNLVDCPRSLNVERRLTD